MKYENAPGYPEHIENNEKGEPINWGMFGYPSMMLDRAIAKDDVDGFNFYVSRYFGPTPMVLGDYTLKQLAERRGAKKIAASIA